MLKKWIALCLVCLMLVPALAVAENPGTYTHADPHYSYTYPEGWTLVSEENMDTLLQLGGALINDEQISASIEQAKAMDMAMFLSPDMLKNINIIYQPLGADLTAEQLVSLAAPSTLEQFKSLYADMQVDNAGEVLTAGENAFAKIAVLYSLADMNSYMAQYMIVLDGVMYVITYTTNADGDLGIKLMEDSLASFSAAK